MLLGGRDAELGRQLEMLRALAFPPGSRALAPAVWIPLARRFHCRRAFVYGDGYRGIVYTYDARTSTLMAHAAIVDGVLRP